MIRFVKSEDYYVLSPLINEWWGGRNMSHLLPKLFFDHFNNTSFIVEEDNKAVGFLIGFLSQSNKEEAYIHFVGVHPEYRKHYIGKQLYHEFYRAVKRENRSIVRAVTSPVNKTSIAYHTKMGFEIKEGDKEVEGVSVYSDYDGPGKDRILFMKNIT
ncbi:GNAT family N-acetyltransferase [Halobacillus sp. Marseille-Q1614]|uniref:GNAT family N-acetyltransferase n=1 Tax=Halobacillus sp. Marseille-Q1614 TaxID=2709134 RepID=UPI0020C1BE4C|nr:GNAT family N-acetyltransferase [Halobacillus sp. Marseille-Q1614]